MLELNIEDLANIEGGNDYSNRECMIAGAVATAGAAFIWTGIGGAALLGGTLAALDGGCFY